MPALAPGRPSLRFAVNGTYADPATTLADGDEVACIPPVSGGAAVDRRRILEIHAEPFPADLVESLTARLATDEDGGVVAFIGRTRATPGTPAPGQEDEAARHAGRRVDGLEYEAFESMAVTVLEAIADVPLGDASVAIVAVAPHRDEAFAAARYAIDETKARAPIWKAERFTDGHVWVGHIARTSAEPPTD